MAKKEIPLTLDEEKIEKAKFAGMLSKQIAAADTAIGKQQAESAEISGNLSGALNLFEKQGGRKDAIKMVSRCLRMEPADFADFWRAVAGYGLALGLFGEDGKPAQMDLLEQQEDQQKNADNIDAATASASKPVVASPSMGAEPVHH